MVAPVVTAGHHAVLYVCGPVEAALTAEAMTDLTGNLWQITAGFNVQTVHKHVVSPTYAVTTSGASAHTVNRLLGTLQFAGVEVAPTFTGKYREMLPLLYAHDFSMKIGPKVVDQTAFNLTPPYTSNARVINTVSGSISTFFDPTEVAFAAPVTEYFLTELMGDVQFALEFYMSANYKLLAWVKVDSFALKQAIEGLSDATISFRGDPDADGRVLSQL